MRLVAVLSALVMATPPALAIDDFLDGKVYAPSAKDCESLKAGESPETFATITSRGLSAYEFTCHFVNVTAITEPRPGWFVDALCELPGETYPDIVSLFPLSAGTLQVTFMMDLVAAQQGGALPPGEYVLCEGLDD